MEPGETPDEFRKRRNRERQVDYRRRRAETRAAELAAAEAAARVQEMTATRGRGRGGRARGGGRAPSGGRRPVEIPPAVVAADDSVDDPFGTEVSTADTMEVDDPTPQSTPANGSSASQAPSTYPELPLSGWEATPARQPDTQATNATAESSRRPSAPPPQYATDYGTAGRQGGGPSAEGMLVSWLGEPETFATWKIADSQARRQMLLALQQRMRALGMAERTSDSMMSKIDRILVAVSNVADEVRHRTGYGVDAETTSSIEDELRQTSEGRWFLELEGVLRDRHSFNPLELHESSEASSAQRIQQDRLLLLRGMPSEEQEEGMATFADLDSRRNDSGNADDTPRSSASLMVAPPTSTRQMLDPGNSAGPASSPLALANRNPAGPSQPRTGPAARVRVPGLYDKAVAEEEGEDGQDNGDRSKAATGKKGKGKAKDEVVQSLSEGFRSFQELAQKRATRLEERAAQRERQEQERLRLENERSLREQRAAAAQERLTQTQLVQQYLFTIDQYILDAELAGEICFRDAWPDVRTTMLRIVERREEARRAAEQLSVDAASDVLGEHSARRRFAHTTAQARAPSAPVATAQGRAPSAPVAINPSSGPATNGYPAGPSRTLHQARPSRPLPQPEAGPSRTVPHAGASIAGDVDTGSEGLTDDAEGEDE